MRNHDGIWPRTTPAGFRLEGLSLSDDQSDDNSDEEFDNII